MWRDRVRTPGTNAGEEIMWKSEWDTAGLVESAQMLFAERD